MGLIGLLLSTSAGGLSVVLSIVTIRRGLRRRKTRHREVSTELYPVSANGSTSPANGRSSALIKIGTADLSSKRRAVAIQSHPVTPGSIANSRVCMPQAAYVLDDNEKEEIDPLTKTIASVKEPKQDLEIVESQAVMRIGTVPLKEFTTQASGETHSSVWELNTEAFHLTDRAAVDDDWTTNESGSETESCSFAGDGFLSEDETMRAAEDENITETQVELPEFSPQNERHDKKVSFELGGPVGLHQDLSHSALDHTKPFTANTVEERNHVASVPLNDATAVDTDAEAGEPPSITCDANSHNETLVPIAYEVATKTQEVIDSVARREVELSPLRSEDENLTKAKKFSFVSVEPLGHIPALEDVLTALPRTMKPTGKGFPEDSPRSREEEKENATSSSASSPERLSRKPRQVERSRMFRRSSNPALKRFRFSDRIKVGPLRTSGNNSK